MFVYKRGRKEKFRVLLDLSLNEDKPEKTSDCPFLYTSASNMTFVLPPFIYLFASSALIASFIFIEEYQISHARYLY